MEAREVVWAKIKGYPWWPARVFSFLVLRVFKSINILFIDS